MKAGFYPKLAWTGIRNNRTMYFPYLLTCIMMVAVYYIIAFLSGAEVLNHMSGGTSLGFILKLGSFVITVFSAIFLFYTNSFLIRRRQKEFGLYNVLGMNKRNIVRILLWETVTIALIVLVIGLAIGIALSKLAELALVNIIGGTVSYSFYISLDSLGRCAGLFCLIFFLILLNALRQLHLSNPAQLLHSESVGEKPPKANWLLGIAGVLILGGAYWIAATIENPMQALTMFFVAVVMVIVGTYLVFISGSVLLCRLLQKKKSYYYRPNHFISVSSMVYRMKRNGAGLASICILATMVLVMISSSACLYFGAEDSLRTRYPRDIVTQIGFSDAAQASEENISQLRTMIETTAAENGADRTDLWDYREATISGLMEEQSICVDVSEIENGLTVSYDNLASVHFIPLEDYNRKSGSNETLTDGQALLFSYRTDYTPDSLEIGPLHLSIAKKLDSFEADGSAAALVLPSLYLIVPDLNGVITQLSGLTDENGQMMLGISWLYGFNTSAGSDVQRSLRDQLGAKLQELASGENRPFQTYDCTNLAANRSDFFATYGGLFFIGIMLSIVFLLAAVLIIYYKQISEGYEDQARFDIMQRVGMTKGEIRSSINSQMLTVFFLPLIFSVLHLAFAFPVIRKLLLLFALNNVPLLLLTTGISVVFFGIFYLAVYRVTSNSYCGIVSGARK